MKKYAGFALIESLIAVLIIALGVVGALGMQMRALTSTTEASMRSEAAIAVEQLVGLMWNDVANINNYAWSGSGSPPASLGQWYSELTTKHIPGAQVSIAITPYGPSLQGGKADITISWTAKGSSEVRRLNLTSFISPP